MFRRIAVRIGLLLAIAGLLAAQPTPQGGSAELSKTLDRLNTLGAVLMFGAHPDDENTAVLAYFARGRNMRTAYFSATRGEGGQNLIGSEQGALMGMIRTQELLEARRIDGAEQYFSRAIDFGFSKSPEEALAMWGREGLLEDMVRAIRRFRPDVILARFPPKPGTGGHGQHTAVGWLGPEAFEAAADPARFPEQIAEGLKPWQARRYLWNTFSFSRRGEQEEAQRKDRLRIDVGEYDPVLGKSFSEIAGESRSMHRSQGMGSGQRKGSAPAFFGHVAGKEASTDLFEDIDVSWNRVPGGDAVGELLARARLDYRPEAPAEILPTLLEAWRNLENNDDPWAKVKRGELAQAIALSAGLWLDASAERWDATPGEELSVELVALPRTSAQVSWNGAALRGIIINHEEQYSRGALSYNKPTRHEFKVAVPAQARPSQPPWLVEEPDGGWYRMADRSRIGDPEPEPLIEAEFRLTFGDVKIPIRRPVVYRWVDRSRGERSRALQITPRVAVSFTRDNLLFPNSGARDVAVVLRSHAAQAEGAASLDAPEGWSVEPRAHRIAFERRGQERTVSFRLSPPKGRSSGRIVARFSGDSYSSSQGVRTIDYDHIPPQVVYPPASLRVERADVELLSKRIGYVMGAGDRIPEALEQLGAEVVSLGEAELASADLSGFDAVIAGVRALNTRPDLIAGADRVLDYVEKGGTFVMQYNTASFRNPSAGPQVAPFPLTPSRGRVTDETAEMKVLLPDHPLLNTPNRITPADFDGWVQERGLYFMSEWDDRYEAPLEAADRGEDPLRGGLLYARYGKGVYIFTGLAFFRELPAGVPGAYRLFANLASAGMGR